MKKILCLLISLSAVFTAAGCREAQITRDEAYLNIINRLTEEYGEGYIEQAEFDDGFMTFDTIKGAGIVRLIDFDGDGNSELYCAYQKESPWIDTQIIYGFNENGVYVLIEECPVSIPGHDYFSACSIFLEKDGIVYLKDVPQQNSGRYLTVRDGKMVTVLSYIYYNSDEPKSSADGVMMSGGSVLAIIEQMEWGGSLRRINFAVITDPDVLTETKNTIDGIKSRIKK